MLPTNGILFKVTLDPSLLLLAIKLFFLSVTKPFSVLFFFFSSSPSSSSSPLPPPPLLFLLFLLLLLFIFSIYFARKGTVMGSWQTDSEVGSQVYWEKVDLWRKDFWRYPYKELKKVLTIVFNCRTKPWSLHQSLVGNQL